MVYPKKMTQIYGKSQEKIDGRLHVEVVQEIMEENERSALKRLLDDEIVYHSGKGYMIYDRSSGDWLRSL